MSRPVIRRFAAFAIGAMLAGACSAPLGPSVSSSSAVPETTTGGSTPASLPSPLASASQSALPSWSPSSTPITFSSDRYGYSVQLPPGWYVREEGPGSWSHRDLSYVGLGTDSFEEDYPGRGGSTDDFPGVTFGTYVSSSDAEGATLDEWTDMLALTVSQDSSYQGEPVREEATVANEPASLLIYDRSDCTHDHHVIVVGLLHGDAGYALLWLARRGEEDSRRGDFEAILRTFRFSN